MSATRLLVLGAIRIMQPVHGYDVRRELLSWRLEDTANVKPGSIYSAIRTLERDGCIAVHARETEDSRPERTSYILTAEGEKEFRMLLRQAWWHVHYPAEPLIPAMAMMPFMQRDELVAALQGRLGQLTAHHRGVMHTHDSIPPGATGADGAIPEHVREMLEFMAARTKAEIDWTRSLIRRLRQGDYRFADEWDGPQLGPGVGLRGPVGEVGPAAN